jgi:hypothetical protein
LLAKQNLQRWPDKNLLFSGNAINWTPHCLEKNISLAPRFNAVEDYRGGKKTV